MRIPDEITNCVGFLCVKEPRNHGTADLYIGTAFFVGVHDEGFDAPYLVTAKHILQGAYDAGYNEIFLRLNTHGNGTGYILLPNIDEGEWVFSDNPAIDVAVLQSLPDHGFSFGLARIPTDSMLNESGLGIGDDLFMVGLFSERWGHRRNVPIMRTGIIAAMPSEPFVDESGELYNAYLVEMRSIGGLSGSPVFVFLNKFRCVDPNIPEQSDWAYFLIGVIRGHWNLYKEDAVIDNLTDNDEIDRLNTGIAQVTPIQDVVQLLYGETLTKQRLEILDEYQKTQAQP